MNKYIRIGGLVFFFAAAFILVTLLIRMKQDYVGEWEKPVIGGLVQAPTSAGEAAAHTIHSVKGMEFPAICVVTTARALGGILDFLENGSPAERAEDARMLYVAASRAQKLLVFAVPGGQADRFCSHLGSHGATVTLVGI